MARVVVTLDLSQFVSSRSTIGDGSQGASTERLDLGGWLEMGVMEQLAPASPRDLKVHGR